MGLLPLWERQKTTSEPAPWTWLPVCVKDGEKMYRVGGPIADSGVVVQRFCQFKWKATLSV